LPHDQLQIVHRDLHVVRLHEAVGLCMARDSGSVRLYCAFSSGGAESTGSPAAVAASLARVHRLFRLADALQSTLSPLQFRGQLVAPPIRAIGRVLGCIGRFRLREQLLDLFPQVLGLLAHPAVAHRLMFRGVRLDLAPIESHTTHARCTQLAGQAQHLLENPCNAGRCVLRKSAIVSSLGF
jgi:hypothetical protein